MSSSDDEDFKKVKRRPRKQKDKDDDALDTSGAPLIDLSTVDLDTLPLADFMKTVERIPRKKHHATSRTDSTAMADWSELEKSSGPYPYVRLLQRAMQFVQNNNPDIRKDAQVSIVAPKVQRDGPKKTMVSNFHSVCESMRRGEDQVMDFLLKEFSTTGNLDGNQSLILKGVYKDTHVEKALRKYIDEFVICSSCKSAQTELSKDPTTRLNIVKCTVCAAARTVQSVTAGYAAQTTRRAIMRAKQT